MNILVVAAHPDDEILGCGGTIARLTGEGHKASILMLGEGVASRTGSGNRRKNESLIRTLRAEARRANAIIGVDDIRFLRFPDNRFDEVPLLEIVKKVEEVIDRTRPYCVFTHHAHDLNIDHRLTHAAVLTATRPMPGQTVREIYSFPALSSTEWTFCDDFAPNTFFDISSMISTKVKALRCYASELRDFPHPRSLHGVEVAAEYWGMRAGVQSAEAFILIRTLK